MADQTTLNTKLERFRKLVLDDAQKKHNDILDQARETRRQRLEEAEHAIREENDTLRFKRSREILASAGQETSRRMMQNKRLIASRREEIGHEVFDAVRERIQEFTQTEEYPDHLKKLLLEAFEALGNPYDGTILLREEDMKYAQDLSRLLPGRHLTFETGSFVLGGLILDCHSKLQRADQSYDSTCENLEGHFAELFGLSLADE